MRALRTWWRCWGKDHKPRAFKTQSGFLDDHVLVRCDCGKRRWLLLVEPLR